MQKNLAAYKVPKQIEFMEELPKSAVGRFCEENKGMEMNKAED
ncbi:MAG: hypothetical protein R2875_01315 [Desulfobacterales bacterium]